MSNSPSADNPIDSEMEKLNIRNELEPVEFSNLTTDVLRVFIEKSELKERLILRKVSRLLRDLVNDQKSIFNRIVVFCNVDRLECSYDGHLAVYCNEHCEIDKDFNRSKYLSRSIVRSKEFEKVAFDDLKFALKHPTAKLSEFTFGFCYPDSNVSQSEKVKMKERSYNNIENVLKSLNHQVSVEKFAVRADKSNDILAILPYLKPGVLRRIEIGSKDLPSEIDEIAELDQWKQAEELFLGEGFFKFYFEHIIHFKRLDLYEHVFYLPVLRRALGLMSKSQNLELCVIDTKKGFRLDLWDSDSSSEDILDDLGEPTVPPKPHLRHRQIPGSNQYLEIEMSPCKEWLTITKMTR